MNVILLRLLSGQQSNLNIKVTTFARLISLT